MTDPQAVRTWHAGGQDKAHTYVELEILHLSRFLVHLRWKLVHVAKDGHSSVGHAMPARHLDHQRTPGVLHDVARVDGKWRQAKQRTACSI